MTQILDTAGQALGELAGLPVVTIAVRALLLCLVLLWLASAWWTWRDARSRSRDAFVPYLASGAVILATPLLFPLAVVVYRIVRPALTVAADESAQLQLALLAEEVAHDACATCGAAVDEEWVACPACGSTLAVRCGSCGRPLELDWTICAWCAADVPWTGDEARPERRRPPRPVAIPVTPGGRPLIPVMAAPDDVETRASREPARRPAGARRRS